jgi:hypothetical protein
MSVRRSIIIAIPGLFAAGSAFAQFGGLGGLLGGAMAGGGGGDVGQQVEEFVKRSALVSALAARALSRVNDAFRSDADAAAAKAEREAISKLTDPKEQQARTAKLVESESAAAAQLAKSSDLESKMASLDATKKRQVADGLFNFGIGVLQAMPLLKNGQGIVQGVASNPMQVMKVVPVKDAIPLLQKVISDGSGTIATLIKVAKGANIEVKTATENSTEANEDIGK